MSDYENQFFDVLKAAGYRPKDGKVVAGNEYHRLFYDGEKQSSGRYSLKIDEHGAVAWFGSERDPLGFRQWNSKTDKKMSKAEIAALMKQREADRAASEKALEEQYERVALALREKWAKLPAASADHPYLVKKKIGPEGLKQDGNRLAVPIYYKGRLCNIQTIPAAGNPKLFAEDARAKGGYLPIAGDDSRGIVIAEGYATARSIADATGMKVVVAFVAGNLDAVAKTVRDNYADKPIIIAADNDQWRKQTEEDGSVSYRHVGDSPENTGLTKAKAAAATVGGRVVFPQVDVQHPSRPTDFNDLHVLEGLDAVRAAFAEAPAEVEPEPPPHEEIPDYGQQQGGAEPDAPAAPPALAVDFESHFKIMGHNHGVYYYLPRGGKQVVALPAPSHTPNNLMRLAILEFWQANFKGDGSNRAMWENATNALIQLGHARGVFKPEKMVRGVGAWIDGGKVALHCGDKVFIEGKAYDPFQVPSKFIYEASRQVIEPHGNPITSAEAVKLRQICESITWENKLSGSLLAGWCVVAPVCAMLHWRPHIWVMGEASAGKSFVMENIIQKIIGHIAIKIEGGTTEAALRQMIGYDGVPIMIDEFEAESQRDDMNAQAVLTLARKASSGGMIVKGTPGGTPLTYLIRSCFCFSSINAAVKQRADESRISILFLKKNTAANAKQHYEALKKMTRETLTDEFVSGLFSRTVANLPTLIANCETFTDAAHSALGDRRAADQIGPMLAGLYLLHSTKRIDAEAAAAFIQNHDWRIHTPIAEAADHERLFDRILTSTMTVTTSAGRIETQVGQAILVALDAENEDRFGKADAQTALKNIDIKVAREGVYIRKPSQHISRMLRDTPWTNGWAKSITNIEGVTATDKPIRFGASTANAVLIPVSRFVTGALPLPEPKQYEIEEEIPF